MIAEQISEAIARAAMLNDFSGWTYTVKDRYSTRYSLPLDPQLMIEANIARREQTDVPSFSLCTRGPVKMSLFGIILKFRKTGNNTILCIIQKDGNNNIEFDCGSFDVDAYVGSLRDILGKDRHTFDPDIPTISIPSDIKVDYGNISELAEAILKNDFSDGKMNGLNVTDMISVRALKGKIRASFVNGDVRIYVRPGYADMSVNNHPRIKKSLFSNIINVWYYTYSDRMMIDLDEDHCNDFL